MRTAYLPFLAVSLLAACVPDACAQTRPEVVELFTSEGCSSCPPAESYLGTLSQRPGVLALAFHVDYWDSPGWHDRFALPQSSQRQARYAHSFGRASVYTPQFVIDGRTDRVGARSDLGRPSGQSDPGVPLRLARDSNGLVVEVGAVQGGLPPHAVVLISYLRRATSVVAAGENAGRTLQEFNIVRSIVGLGTWRGQESRFQVPAAGVAADASDVAVLIQTGAQGPIVGAASLTLRP